MSEISRKELGLYIAKSRRKAGLTQKEVAQKLNVSQPYYSQIEKGFHEIHEERLADLSTILGTSSEQILQGLEDANERSKKPLKELLPGDPDAKEFFSNYELVRALYLDRSINIIHELRNQLNYQISLLKSANERNKFLRDSLKSQIDEFQEFTGYEALKKIFPDLTKEQINEMTELKKKLFGLDIEDPLNDYLNQFEKFNEHITKRINQIYDL